MTDRQEFQRCTGELSEGPGDDGESVPGRSIYVLALPMCPKSWSTEYHISALSVTRLVNGKTSQNGDSPQTSHKVHESWQPWCHITTNLRIFCDILYTLYLHTFFYIYINYVHPTYTMCKATHTAESYWLWWCYYSFLFGSVCMGSYAAQSVTLVLKHMA